MRQASKQITNIRPAGPDHQVVSVEGEHRGYRRAPCGGCPWKLANEGTFPAKAFEHSAGTAYDMAQHVFACHESGVDGGHTCAGFLLRGAEHNLSVRLGHMSGRYAQDVTDGGHELYESYRTMAIANGVDPDSPALKACRP
ncbi:DUF6283 family protein [Polaromonas sp.]|uniref:DUF6283 family protein n=1 Tax=Polaromonas sp. TaxID=1869339 RepID=UPI00352B2B8B